jgi:CHAT domain-containing protein
MIHPQMRLALLGCLALALTLAVVAQTPAPATPKELPKELADALLLLKSEAERGTWLESHKEIVSENLVDELQARGKAALDKREIPAAQIAFQAARMAAERVGYSAGAAAALHGLGWIELYRRSELKAALEFYQQALKLAGANGNPTLSTVLHNDLCLTQLRLGNYEQATEHCQSGLALAENLGNKLIAALTLSRLGIIARQRGQYESALTFYRKSLVVYEALGDKLGIAVVLNNVGNVYNSMGNATAALQHYLRSLSVAEASGNKSEMANALKNASMIHHVLGNYPLALEYSQRALSLSEALGDKHLTSVALEALGVLHAQAGEHAQALECYRKSLTLMEQTEQQTEIAVRLLSVGDGYQGVSDPDQAVAYYQRGLALSESLGRQTTAIYALSKLSRLCWQQGRHAEALAWAEKAIVKARQLGAHNDYWRVLLIAGAASRKLKRFEQGQQYLQASLDLIETERTQLSAGAREQAAYFADRFDPYVQMVTLLTEQNRMAEAFSYAERAKARVLLDVLRSGKVSINQAMTVTEQEQEKRLRDEMAALNNQLRNATQASKPDPQRTGELKANLQKARLTYETFQTQLYLAHPELKVQRGEAQPLKLEEAAALLPRTDVVLLEYVVAGEETYLFTLTKAAQGIELKAFPLNVKQAELEKLTNAYRQQLASLDLKFRATGKQLYDLLLKPAQAQLTGKTQLVIVPDGKLWELPFQSLVTPKNQYLIETAAVSYAPSLTVLREMQRQRKARATNADLLAFGNPSFGQETTKRVALAYRDEKLVPLPEAESEVKALGQLYGARSRIYTNAEAREDRLKTEAGNAGVLHISTHGILNDAAPLYSHLALAQGDEKEDGLLEAWELMQMDLKADLAVLSACETARGRIGAGEGVIGLSWALFVAGVPSTVVSQWKVESSSTRELMLGFHRGLRNQTRPLTKAEALRRAVLPLLKSPRTNHPFYWAGFVLVGDER